MLRVRFLASFNFFHHSFNRTEMYGRMKKFLTLIQGSVNWFQLRFHVIYHGIGSALTFSQMLFVTLVLLPAYITCSPSSTRLAWPLNLPFPRLKPCTVPICQWALQVSVFTSGSLLNNWVFAFDVPLSVMIVFRSGGVVALTPSYAYAD
jgi:hypothetical protein